MYYTVTVSYKDAARRDTFKIDENEIIPFIQFLHKHVNNLAAYFVIKHLVKEEPNDSWTQV
jgi:hypothetical protein